ncbi:hypothetical protein [Caballeronia sp. BCC1704]|uniref:hypothetical protein n=1 Tax=Caballeronia sp. BCC1704 TaxID=2676300 RepID=UPI001589C801|nr:hypothetical protein [Caballeronia sp. BCC1704]
MNAAEIVSKARALGVELRTDGTIVNLRGPRDAREKVRPDIAAHKPAVIAYLLIEKTRDAVPEACRGALLSEDGGYYLPWGPYLTREALAEWQRELFAVVDELATLEGWPELTYDLIAGQIERQPISTIRPDLAYFRGRLERAKAERRERERRAARSWRGEGLDNRRA